MKSTQTIGYRAKVRKSLDRDWLAALRMKRQRSHVREESVTQFDGEGRSVIGRFGHNPPSLLSLFFHSKNFNLSCSIASFPRQRLFPPGLSPLSPSSYLNTQATRKPRIVKPISSALSTSEQNAFTKEPTVGRQPTLAPSSTLSIYSTAHDESIFNRPLHLPLLLSRPPSSSLLEFFFNLVLGILRTFNRLPCDDGTSNSSFTIHV